MLSYFCHIKFQLNSMKYLYVWRSSSSILMAFRKTKIQSSKSSDKGEQAIAKEKIEDLTFQVESLHKRLDEFNKLLKCQRCTNCIKLEKIIVQYREKVLQIEMLKLDNILEKLNNK